MESGVRFFRDVWFAAACVAAVGFGGAGRAWAQSDTAVTYGNLEGRGVVSANGNSYGAFTVNPDSLAYQNNVVTGDFGSTITFDAAYADPTLAAGTPPVTVSYPNGTGGLTVAPLALALWLPGPGTTIDAPAEFDFTGSTSEQVTFTYLGDSVKFSGALMDTDPYSGMAITLNISGIISAGTNGGPNLVTISTVVREASNSCSDAVNSGFLITEKAATDTTDTPSGVTPVSTSFCTASPVPEPAGWSTALPGLLCLGIASLAARRALRG